MHAGGGTKRSRGEKKCSDCRRIVADRQQSYAAQQYAAAHPNPEGATGTPQR